MKTSTSDASPNDQLDVSLKKPGHKTLDVNSSITDAITFNVDNPFSSCETTFTSEQIQHRNAYEKIAYSIIRNPINGTIVSGLTLMKTSKVVRLFDWNHRVYVLFNWENGDPAMDVSISSFRVPKLTLQRVNLNIAQS